MLVNFLRVAVLRQESSENPMPAEPEDLGRQPGFSRTTSLTIASVTSKTFRSLFTRRSCAGMNLLHIEIQSVLILVFGALRTRVFETDYTHLGRLADHETILNELANVLARVRSSDFINL